MPAILIYLIKLSCSLGLLWLFYRLVLRGLTFYTWNRWYLLGYAVLSFLIPFVNIGPIDQEDPSLQPLIIQYIPVIGKPADQTALPVITAQHWNIWQDVVFFLALGSCFLLLRLLFRWYSLRRLRRQAILLQQTPVKIYRVTHPIAPFSFGKAIYINTEIHTEKEWEEIVLHEYVHIRQRHTIDILLGELLVIVNWYNPFAWLIRYSIRQNLEFIADRAVVDNGADKKGYQYHLLKVVGQNHYRLTNNFNFSSLKKRIIMMNKSRSARLHLLRFLFILPLLTILLVAFRHQAIPPQTQPQLQSQPQPERQTQPQPQHHVIASVIDTVPRKTDTSQPKKVSVVVTGYHPRDTSTTPLDNRKAFWIVDGEAKPRGWDGQDSVQAAGIESMHIYKGEDAIRFFGDKGADGVIIVTTKKGQIAMAKLQIVRSDAPLMVVDGVPKEDGVGDLSPNAIESITVLKPEAAKAVYGEKAVNGVVLIRTKKDAHSQNTIDLKNSNLNPPRITSDLKDANGNPIIQPGDTVVRLGEKTPPQK